MDQILQDGKTKWIALKIHYVLDSDLPPLLKSSLIDFKQMKAERKKCEEDKLVGHGHILNTLTDCLYDFFLRWSHQKKIGMHWRHYKNKKKGMDKLLAMKYFKFQITDNMPIINQVHEL